LRPRIAQGVAAQIVGVTDAAQKVTLAQGYQGVFKEQSEQELIVPVLIASYAAAKRVDEAFSTGSEFLAHDPDSVSVLVDLTLIGTEQAKQHNAKFVPQSLQFGAHAIELMEANRKPAAMTDAGWKDYKSSMLPAMYQSMGLLSLVKGDRDESKARFTKAAELSPTDAFNYLMLTGILNDEYQAEAKRYQAMTAGPAKQAELQKAQGMLDGVIDAYAHAIALSEGNTAFQAIRQQYLQDLEAYYKYRHNNSTAGMQQLIDKYKILNLKP
jgi:tetratricopeptide (TPR) repeat protein